ncbi:MAG: sugar ABC transporter ATP-binding protein [Pseudomonadota bacterium]
MSDIVIENVEKRFGETHALAGASLSASLGEIHAIVGENGSGKSTLAKVVAGVIVPDGGHVNVLGIHPKNPAEAIAHGITTIFQEIMVAEDLAVWENVFAGSDGLWRKHLSNKEKRRRSADLLARLTKSSVDVDARVATLPLSVKQWVVIARAILREPKVLVFDESSAALDLDATNRLHGEMRRLRDAGSCVMLVTHRIAELVNIADTATVLRDGKTVGRLSRGEITEDNIISLMSGADQTASSRTREKRVVSTAQKPVLAAKGVRLTPQSSAIDFHVNAGEVVGIAGLDGSGQSEFVRVLACIDKPASGEVSVTDNARDTRAIASLKEAEDAGITYVSGDRKREGIFANLSILENFGVALMDRVSGRGGIIDRASIATAYASETKRLGIKFGKVGDKIGTLSGGNQQKVLIARAFARSPRVIVLNDPARGVDIGTKQDLYKHLRDFAANGGAVIYLSSEIEEFFDFADRADVFVDGGLFASFEGEAINEENMLSAMFGRTGHVEFDLDDDGQPLGKEVA